MTADGQVLPLRKWLPHGEVKAVILALHGFNDYSNAFEAAGKAWAERGIATYAYDQRGFGAAPERGLWPGRAVLAADAATAARILRAQVSRGAALPARREHGRGGRGRRNDRRERHTRSRCRRRHPERSGGVGPSPQWKFCPAWRCGPGCA